MEWIIVAFVPAQKAGGRMGYLLAFLFGVLCCPLVIFIRARRDGEWDDSNMMNIYRIVAHLATHPSDFGKMVYEGSDKRPFWYIDKDEFESVVNTRPDKD